MRSALLAIGCLAGLESAYAQYGVSPSQTGMFFDDLRARAENRTQTGGVRQGEGIYDFSQEGFTVGADGQPTSPMADAARQVNQGYTSSGGIVYSQRLAGDYTQYSGPYPSSGTFFAPAYTSDPYLGGKRNLKVGPVNFGFGLTSAFEYNDNINRGGAGIDEETALAGLYLNIDANYPITETNSLTLSTVVGFDYYFMNAESSPYGEDMVWSVLPGSAFSFDGKIGPVYYVIYDRMSVRPASQNDFALNDSEIFGVFQNDAGLGAAWAINSALNLSVNYMHSNAMALEEENEIYDRNTDSVQASLAWSPSGTWTTGLEGSMTWVRYPKGYNNDGRLSTAGAFFAMPVGNSTYFRVAGGMQDFQFDEPDIQQTTVTQQSYNSLVKKQANLQADVTELQSIRNPSTAEQAELNRKEKELDDVNGDVLTAQSTASRETDGFNSKTNDTSDLSEFYYNATISNRLSSRVSHALTFGHESSLNTTSNYVTADYVSYGVGIIAWRGSRLSISGYYEDSEESGGTERTGSVEGDDLETVALSEDIEQYGFDVYLSHQFTPRLRGGVGYHFGISESSKPERSYDQNAFNVDLSYLLTKKLSLSAGWRYFTTDADDDIYDFDQNRVVFSANYNF